MNPASAKGYINVTVLNVGGRRKKADVQAALMHELFSIRTGLVLFQEWDEGGLQLPVPCCWDKKNWLATALNEKLGDIRHVSFHEIQGKGHHNRYSQTDLLVSEVTLNPPRAGWSTVRVINMHFHHLMASLTFKGNHEQRQRIFDLIATISRDAGEGTPTLLGGDFNSRCWQMSTELRERGLEVEPLVLPENMVDGERIKELPDGQWADCIGLFFIGPKSLLPPKRTPNHFKTFDPQRVLIGHGAHGPVACYLSGHKPLRSASGDRRHKLRRVKGPNQASPP